MKHIKSLLCAILAAAFIFAPAALAAESAHDTVNPAACSHSYSNQPISTGVVYIDQSSMQHIATPYKVFECVRCGYLKTEFGISYSEYHRRMMYSAICGGATHYYRYRCDKCRRFMGETTEPCPRPGNCPGLPLSMILLPK